MIKLLDILLEDNKIFVPRRTKERKEKVNHMLQQKIQKYIDGGSKGSLNLINTPISSLPDNLKIVRGFLDLSDTSITSLPSGLKVSSYLNLIRTPIASLPSDLKVSGNLYLKNTPMSKKYTEGDIRKMCPGIKGRRIII